MIRQHQPAHPVAHGDIWAPLRKGDLYAGRAPRDERGQSPLADPQETLVHVGWVYLTLDDVQNGDVAALLARYRGDHAVLGLQ